MFERFQHRSLDLERLDTGDYTSREYVRWQREMKYIHGIFGEERALKNTLLRDIRSDDSATLAVLDVGAGSGRLLRKLSEWTEERKTFLVGAELDGAAAQATKSASVMSVQCNAIELPFADDSFDYVFCSLFLHHLADDDAVALMREMARVAVKRIYAIDLDRNPGAYYAYKIIGWPFLQRFTLEDGALSILRSRTRNELFRLADTAGLRDVKIEHSRANRLILIGK